MSPDRPFTSTAEWRCSEPVAGPVPRSQKVFSGRFEACSQGMGSVITEPPTDGQRTPLQDFETLYIGGAEPAVVRQVRVGQDRTKSRLCAIAKESLTTTMARIVRGSGPMEQHEVER